MKIFFGMSYRGDKKRGRWIYQKIKELGYTHTSNCYEQDVPEKFYSYSREEMGAHYKRIFSEIAEADIFVAENSIYSVTAGQMIQKALDLKIPVLVLHTEGNIPFFLEGMEYEEGRLTIMEYNENNLEKVLKEGIEYLSENLEKRFTLILPNKILKYLDRVAEEGKSRSEYIRDLIEKDMEGK